MRDVGANGFGQKISKCECDGSTSKDRGWGFADIGERVAAPQYKYRSNERYQDVGGRLASGLS